MGAVSVFKAVYIDKRELKCACVGGSSNVPLGFLCLLTENLMMMVMGLWMPVLKLFGSDGSKGALPTRPHHGDQLPGADDQRFRDSAHHHSRPALIPIASTTSAVPTARLSAPRSS